MSIASEDTCDTDHQHEQDDHDDNYDDHDDHFEQALFGRAFY